MSEFTDENYNHFIDYFAHLDEDEEPTNEDMLQELDTLQSDVSEMILGSITKGKEKIEDLLNGTAVIFDTTTVDGQRFLNLLQANQKPFLAHAFDQLAFAASRIGMWVWKGTATVNAQGETSFDGTFRRPRQEDYIEFEELMTRFDKIARDEKIEHAKTCQKCALRLGMELQNSVDPDVLASGAGGETGQA